MEQNIAEFNDPEFEWLFIFIIYANHTVDENKVINPSNEAEAIIGETQRWVNHLYNNLSDINITEKHKIAIIHNRVITGSDLTHFQERKIGEKRPVPIILPVPEELVLQKQFLLRGRIAFIKNRFKAKKHCIITCDHGTIFGINKVQLKDGKMIKVKLTNSFDKRDYSIYKDRDEVANLIALNGAVTDDQITRFEILTNEELAMAILQGLDKKAELVIMYNCCMQNIMTQYALKDAAEMLIAGETTMAYPGYNFENIFNVLFSLKEEIFAPDIAGLLIDSFTHNNNKYKPIFNRGQLMDECIRQIDSWAVIAIDLSKIDNLFIDNFNLVCGEFILNMNRLFDRIRFATSSLFPFDISSRVSSSLYDFWALSQNLMKELDENGLQQEFPALVNALNYFIDNFVIDDKFIYQGKSLYNPGGPNPQDFSSNPPPSGLGIFFPQSRLASLGNNPTFLFFQGIDKPSFLANTKWQIFCDNYTKITG